MADGAQNRVLDVKPNDERFAAKFADCVGEASIEVGTTLLPGDMTAPNLGVVLRTWRELQAEDPLVVHLWHDTQIATTWMSVSGSTEARRAALVKNLDRVLPVISVPDLTRSARGYDEDPDALIRLALAWSGSPDTEVRTLLLDALGSKQVDVRIAAAFAMALLKWPSFEKTLSDALAGETDMVAREVLRTCGGRFAHP
jgi:hypothetical protein